MSPAPSRCVAEGSFERTGVFYTREFGWGARFPPGSVPDFLGDPVCTGACLLLPHTRGPEARVRLQPLPPIFPWLRTLVLGLRTHPDNLR